MDATTMLRRQETSANAILAFHRLPIPVIAAVNGAATGAGFSLALSADIRLATPHTRFNAAFVRIGLSGGDCGSSWLLPRIVGTGPAADILLTGRFVGAEEAQRIGLVSRTSPAGDLLTEALTTAAQISSNSPSGIRLTKSALHANTQTTSLEAAVELENRNQVLATRTPHMAEALAAFREKRTPQFDPPALQ
ncbi:enoyl-CoA hydratase/isomerase family protein [Sciscionella marina]|uniref:enoyl-CoA hydratase/isomerase family protein n=1 Tax=Sciscionella marina TaxID=508770 RepID=UPI00036BE964|nr:enoyl-CoA hydratase-related protein [Sciscionella marina]